MSPTPMKTCYYEWGRLWLALRGHQYQHGLAQARPVDRNPFTVSKNEATFYETWRILNKIAIDNNDIFSVHTDGDTAYGLLMSVWLPIPSQIAVQTERGRIRPSSPPCASQAWWTIFATRFWLFLNPLWVYVIKDYNKDGGGKYAEYYTPHSVAKIIADILRGMISLKTCGSMTRQLVRVPCSEPGGRIGG